MHYGKALLVASLLTTLLACSHSAKKDKEEEAQRSANLYDLPDTVDYQKAARINIELGLNYLKQEQSARAKAKLLRAKKLAPQLPEVHYSYGYFLEHVGEIENAEKEYLKALALNPKGGNEHNNYGTFLCRQHHYRQAEKEFLKAIEDSNYMNTAEALENAGLCVLQVPDIAKATEYFEKALRYEANRPNSLLELAVIYLKQRKLSISQGYYNRYTQTASPTSRSLLVGIELARSKGDKNKEASYRAQLRKRYPQAPKEHPLRLSAVSSEIIVPKY